MTGFVWSMKHRWILKAVLALANMALAIMHGGVMARGAAVVTVRNHRHKPSKEPSAEQGEDGGEQ